MAGKPRSQAAMIDAYKRAIWNKGGRVPKGIKHDPKPSQIADLDSRLRSLDKKKG